MTEPASPKRTVRLLSLNINDRDLSIALVMLKQVALRDADVAANYDIHIHQWQKDFARMGEAGTVDGLDLDRVVDSLSPESTDVFGFSTYTWNHHFMVAVARRVKERNPDAVLLFGGAQAGGYGARWLEDHPFADYVIKGEAEFAFRTFLKGLLVGDVSDTPNLFWRDEQGVRTRVPAEWRAAKKQSYLPSIEALPFAHHSKEYRDYLDNLDHQVTAQFETERGCPLQCAFCSWGTGLPIRRRSREDVEEGLLYLLNHPNVRAVYVVDANPFINQEKGLWLSEFVLHRNKSGKPVFFELNPEYVRDPRVIENLGRLNGDELAFGLQSTSDITLKKIRRKFHRETYKRNVSRLRELNPRANIKFSLILGLPADTYATFTQSLDFVISMVPNDIYVHDLLVLPGSAMYNDPESFGVVIDREPPHRLVSNETFPAADYDRAKHLGFATKVLHNDTLVRDSLLALQTDMGGRHVDLYASFVDFLEANGVDFFAGRPVGEVSSEEFDFLTKSFHASPRRAEVRALLVRFAASCRAEVAAAAK